MASAKVTELPAATAPQATDEMYIVRPSAGAAGSLSVTNDALFSTITNNIADRALRFQAAPAPSISAPGTGSIDYNGVNNRFEISENGGAYRPIGDVTSVAAPNISTDKIASFQLATGKVIQDTNIAIDAARNALVYPDNVRQTFNPGANVAWLNVGVQTPDPTAAVGGDLWFHAATSRLMTNACGITQPVGNMVADGLYSATARRIIYEASAPFNTARADIAISASNGSLVYNANNRQTFAPGATAAGLNVGAVAVDPGALNNGDIWYNSATGQLFARINGQNVPLGGVPPGVARGLPPNTTSVGTAPLAAPTILQTFVLPLNTLKSDNDYACFELSGDFAHNTNSKQIFINFIGNPGIAGPTPISGPGVAIEGAAAVALGNNVGGFKVFLTIVRKTADSFIGDFTMVFGVGKADVSAPQTLLSSGFATITGSIGIGWTGTGFDWATSTFTVETQGTGVAQDDVVQNLTTCEFYNF